MKNEWKPLLKMETTNVTNILQLLQKQQRQGFIEYNKDWLYNFINGWCLIWTSTSINKKAVKF